MTHLLIQQIRRFIFRKDSYCARQKKDT